jgi:hypothetical protein
MRRQVFPTAPSPTTTHLQIEIVSHHSFGNLSSHDRVVFIVCPSFVDVARM